MRRLRAYSDREIEKALRAMGYPPERLAKLDPETIELLEDGAMDLIDDWREDNAS